MKTISRKWTVLLSVLFLVSSCMAQGVHRFDNVFARGNGTQSLVVPFSKISVCVAGTGCAQLQNIFTDMAMTNRAKNPITANANGFFDYYFTPGCVDEQQTSINQGMNILINVCQFLGAGSGVTQIVAGTNITLSPSNGLGAVTINSTAAGAGTVNAGTAFSPTYYAATGTVVSGVTPFSGFQVDSTSAAPRVAVQTDFNPFLTAPGPIGSVTPNTGVFSALTDSALTPGNCIQASTGGLLTTVAGPCSTGGTVTSVGITVPSWLTAGSAVTSSGVIPITATTGEPANQFIATPDGTSGAVGLRAIVASDIPTLNQNTLGSAATASAFLSTPTLCPAGQAPTGILANGNSTGCAPIGLTSYTVRIKTNDYTAVANDAVFVNTSGGGHTITLPAAASNSGAIIVVKKISTDANNLTIARTGSDLIDSATSQATTLPNMSYTFVSDGVSNWWII